MFEQSLYEQEAVATPTQEGDLFHNYEIKNWELSSRLYKILALAGVVNVLGLIIFAQTSLLTMKGCDSPLVGRVCQVLDTVYVGALLFGTDRDFIDAAYDKTDLGDAEITFVDVTNVDPRLDYPASFVDATTGETVPMFQQAALHTDLAFNTPGFSAGIPGIPDGIPITKPSTGGSIFDTTPNPPAANPNVIEGELPSSFGNSGVASDPTMRKRRRGGRVTVPSTDDTVAENANSNSQTADPTPTPLSSEAVTAVEINKKPLTDFADVVSAKWEANEIDLNKDFTLFLNGYITPEGRLDRTKSKFDPKKTSGDPKMIDIGKAALEALGDSGYLTYLKLAGVDQVMATLTQDNEQIKVVITSTQKSAERANSVSSIVSFAIMTGKLKVENPSDERTLLDGAKVTTDGKTFTLNFAIPKPIAHEMITRKLKEAQAKRAQPQPNGNSVSKPNDNTAQK